MKQLIKKISQAALVVLAINTGAQAIAADSLELVSPAVKTFKFEIGDQKTLTGDDGDYIVSLVDVQDSRCPANAICVWAGKVTATFAIQQAWDDARDIVRLDDIQLQNVTYKGLELALGEVTPYPGLEGDVEGKTVELIQLNPSKRCEQVVYCTMEYNPTQCSYQGQSFRGSNPCFTWVEVERFACLNNLILEPSEVSCEQSWGE